MKSQDTVIHLVILVAIVSFGVLFYSLGSIIVEKQMLALEETRQIGDRLDTLNQRVMTNPTLSEGDTSELREGDTSTDTSISVRDYRFTLPSGWWVSEDSRELSAINDGDEVSIGLSNINDVEVARLRCPVVDTGYEMWEFADTTKSFIKNGISYEATLRIGSPVDQTLEPLYLMTFHTGDESEGQCEMISSRSDEMNTLDMSEIEQAFRDMFDSVTIQ